MNGYELAMAVVVGLGLAAACGFRVFVPLLVLSIGVRAEMLNVASNMEWVGSTPALAALAVATALEIGGYYVPWLDNLLDTLASPVAVVAGVLSAGSVLVGMDPLLQWAVAAIVGGGAAGGVQALTVTARAVSTATTGGLGNVGVSTVEAGAATGLSVLAILAPLIAVGLLVAAVLLLGLFVRRHRRRSNLDRSAGVR